MKKQRMNKNKISGVYKITNKITGDFYIGSSKDVKHRWATHKSLSTWKIHPNSKLYKAMDQYGRENFILDVIEETTDLHIREQYFIEQLRPSYNDIRAKGWNIERLKESKKRCSKDWYLAHQDEELIKRRAYYNVHRDKISAKRKAYYSRLCLYEGETLTLKALINRLFRQGVPHYVIEAKKYLIEEEN